MCGILGSIPVQDEQLFLNSLNKLRHRGPDGFGIWKNINAEVMLGHRRLSILDLSENGKQPMHYEYLSIVFNGEIYNFIELKNELISKGYKFYSDSDTEVVLAAFLHWGAKCFQRFNGMWALAIWNEKTKELLLSRDRYGKKPLFYALTANTLIFGSEMKAIAPMLNEIKISDNFNWCKNNLYLYESTDKCLINGIQRFPIASYAIYRQNDTCLKPVRYWNTLENLQEIPLKYEDQVDMFKEIFEDACKIRMRSDVKIGTALSGGLDSSAVISMVDYINRNYTTSERIQNGQHAVIASFPGSKLNETYFANKVVNHLGIEGTFVEIDVAKSVSNFADYTYKFEEIYTTPPHSMIATYEAIKTNGITVSLDGHGADEILAGYGANIYEAFYDAGLNCKDIKSIIGTRYGLIEKEANALNYLDILKYPITEGLKKTLHVIADNVSLIRDNIHMPAPSAKYIKKIGHFNSLLLHGVDHTTLPTLLRNFDRLSMAASVEIRMPFLDYRLVDYAFSLPWNSKIRNGFTKNILRDAIASFLPNEVVYRKSKIGFNTPVSHWVKTGWREFILDTINSSSFINCALINVNKTRKLAEKIIKNTDENYFEGFEFWYNIAPYFWEQYFLKQLK